MEETPFEHGRPRKYAYQKGVGKSGETHNSRNLANSTREIAKSNAEAKGK
jgi:hypothetical protein